MLAKCELGMFSPTSSELTRTMLTRTNRAIQAEFGQVTFMRCAVRHWHHTIRIENLFRPSCAPLERVILHPIPGSRFQFPAQAKQDIHPSGVGELVPNMPE